MAARQNAMASHTDSEPQEAKGFAKLDFPDGDYIITTTKLVIGRNMELADQWKRHKKQERHQQRAREALEQYELEPSQPSQPDDGMGNGHPSSSSQSLTGAPERGLPSNFSEQGGAVHYHDNSADDDMSRSRKRRRLQYSNSSNASVTPASVHPSQIDLSGGSWSLEEEPENHASARLPVHPARHEDIKRISHEHLEITYNAREEQWELHVIGNRAFVNEQLLDRGSIVPLEHNDEIMIPGVHMTFKLPDKFRSSPVPFSGTFSEPHGSDPLSDEDEDAIDSPVRQRSRAKAGHQDSESDSDLSDSPRQQQKRSGIKLKLKKGGQTKPKRGAKAASPISDEEQEPQMGKQETFDGQLKESGNDDDRNSPVAAPVFEPGSVLADVPQDQLPQKRKGPGRPPKNGFVSKKDDKQVRKKMKEYESRGEEAPSYAQLVDEVRREAKIKELQNKSGQTSANEPPAVMNSIEIEPGLPPAEDVTALPTTSSDVPDMPNAQSPAQTRKPSPKIKQVRKSKSPSPVKPLEECTEEELKKPNMTYVPLIDEAIRASKKGYADLQEIYRTIQKLHPFFLYTAKGTGWQSSVRHNLKSERFKQVGKSGKGAYHAINWDYPLPNSDQKKGRRTTPPPRQMAMQNGQYIGGQGPHMQYAQQYQYGNGLSNGYDVNNAAAMQGNPGYRSPYGNAGAPGPVAANAPHHPAGAQHHGQNGSSGPSRASGTPVHQQQPQQPQQMDQYGGLVTEIMDWRVNYLKPFVGTEAYPTREETFKAIIELLSGIFGLSSQEYILRRQVLLNQLKTEDERHAFVELAPLFDKYQGASVESNGRQGGSGQIQPTASQQQQQQQQRQSQPQATLAQPQPVSGNATSHGSLSSAEARAATSAPGNQSLSNAAVSSSSANDAAVSQVPSGTGQTVSVNSIPIPRPPSNPTQPPVVAVPLATNSTASGSVSDLIPSTAANSTPAISDNPLPTSTIPASINTSSNMTSTASPSSDPHPHPTAPMLVAPPQPPTPPPTISAPAGISEQQRAEGPPAAGPKPTVPSQEPPSAPAISAAAGTKRAASAEPNHEIESQQVKRFKSEA